MNYTLHNYQDKVFGKVMAHIHNFERSILIQMPTRSGKSAVASKLIEYFSMEKKEAVYFTGHTKILITQMSDELTDHGIKHGIIAPWAPQIKYRVQVISKDTLFNRFKKMKNTGWKEPMVIIVDECHLSMSARYKEILDSYPDSIIIGLTATPDRLDGKGLDNIFDVIVKGPSIKWLQENGYLCPTETFAVEFDDTGMRTSHGDYNKSDVIERVDKPKVLKDIVKHWEMVAKNKKTLSFCASIQHAHDLAEEFNEAGYPSVAISSKDGKMVIDQKLQEFYSGKYINLCSVDLFIMGFTVRDCECIVQARPTQSLMIYLQQLGRGMMFLPGKILINLDCVNNWTRHGLPDDDRNWSLAGRKKRAREAATLKRCPECFHPVPVATRICSYCGHAWTETADAGSRIPEEKAGKLVSLRNNDLVIEIARGANSLGQAIRIAKARGISTAVATRIWRHDLKGN
jgi:superfamily II DNA or RNA helicase